MHLRTLNLVLHVRQFSSAFCAMQAQSAKLIGDAIQKNPAFLTLRKIEVCLLPILHKCTPIIHFNGLYVPCLLCDNYAVVP